MAGIVKEPFNITIGISAGKKELTVFPEEDRYTLKESGSIVAVIKQNEGRWQFTTGSYTNEDAQKIGAAIVKLQKP